VNSTASPTAPFHPVCPDWTQSGQTGGALPDVAAGGAATRERSPPDITAAPRGPAGCGCAPPGRVARNARHHTQCGHYARAPRGHQAPVPVGFVSARPRLPPTGAPAPPSTGWCYMEDGAVVALKYERECRGYSVKMFTSLYRGDT